jgi:hypothetical protein
MRFVALQRGAAAYGKWRYPVAMTGNALLRAELVHMMQEVLRSGWRIRSEEVPVEAEAGHEKMAQE